MRLRRLPVYVDAYKEKPNAEIFIYYSSRGTGKTYDIATVNLERKFSADGGDTLAIRKKKNKTTQSIHKEILELLSIYNLRKFFNISKAKIESKSLIFGKKRAFVFEGGHDTRDLKSYAHFKDLWLEEANQFSADDIEMLVPTMREQGGRIYMSSNPVPKSHWLYKRYLSNQDNPAVCIIKSTYRDNPFLNGGDVQAWLEKQRLAYHGNDIGFRIEVLGEEFDFGTARLIKKFNVCGPEILSRTNGSYYTGIHVKGNRICFLEILVGRISYLPVVIITNACSKVLLSKTDYQSEINKFKGVFVLPTAREELKYVFSRFGRGTLLAKKRNLYSLSDYLIPSNLNVVNKPETTDVISEFNETEYYYDESSAEDSEVTNFVMQKDLVYIPAFLNAISVFS
ncbi:PBSX family phage terminase large subunit [Borreliella burgdorferi]|uniref:PBSX family phage terminase large subunit n=1 Tax=Borreliella burgdorferi TaxID=139 RepID=UPI00017F42B6|nr:PBSX family phage terminase large subunit [Borreliella burgdorferi]ACO38473.1 phage terminase, large subunit, pbsx family [Borreliella burgdorferi 29805]MCD2330994.1 PBSX family phage terminase large subunit [Borreliella burgdorferi]MCD2408678.1 PBSX family phage terminase large subunit [Borreliella burgdorferi]PRR51039.1 PBSX family phage terminase large subunit [Borreliella burgdorferi]PRR64293.1 PBSX family phage terminase large subunit [Borreliella burgdorferi]